MEIDGVDRSLDGRGALEATGRRQVRIHCDWAPGGGRLPHKNPNGDERAAATPSCAAGSMTALRPAPTRRAKRASGDRERALNRVRTSPPSPAPRR